MLCIVDSSSLVNIGHHKRRNPVYSPILNRIWLSIQQKRDYTLIVIAPTPISLLRLLIQTATQELSMMNCWRRPPISGGRRKTTRWHAMLLDYSSRIQDKFMRPYLIFRTPISIFRIWYWFRCRISPRQVYYLQDFASSAFCRSGCLRNFPAAKIRTRHTTEQSSVTWKHISEPIPLLYRTSDMSRTLRVNRSKSTITWFGCATWNEATWAIGYLTIPQ